MKGKWKNKQIKKIAADVLFLLLACCVGAFATVGVMLPNGLTIGGLTGIVRIVQTYIPVDFSLLYYGGSLLILIISAVFLGLKEVRKILFLTILYPAVLFVFETLDVQLLEESSRAIKSESDHMKKLVEQLLFLARGDSGKTRLVMEKVSLGNLMKEVLDESVLIDPKHHYILKNEEDDLLITGDSSMIKQAARILVDNAAKYTPEGGDILLRTGRNEKGHSFFLVQDEGIGISPDDTPHIFERFFRSDPARSRESGGTGLGLSIAKWIIDRHGGYFQVLSREGIGTRITVCFPS